MNMKASLVVWLVSFLGEFWVFRIWNNSFLLNHCKALLRLLRVWTQITLLFLLWITSSYIKRRTFSLFLHSIQTLAESQPVLKSMTKASSTFYILGSPSSEKKVSENWKLWVLLQVLKFPRAGMFHSLSLEVNLRRVYLVSFWSKPLLTTVGRGPSSLSDSIFLCVCW